MAPRVPRPNLFFMLARLSRWAVARRGAVLGACALVTCGAALLGRGLFGRLGYPVFRDPAAESSRAEQLARDLFGAGDIDAVALYRLPDGAAPELGVEDPAVEEALGRTLDRVARDPSVARVFSELGAPDRRFVSRDGRSTFVALSLRGDARAKARALERLRSPLALELAGGGALQPLLGGPVAAGRSLTRLAEQSLKRGEAIALPISAALLVVIFGGVVAASLPLAIGALSIVLALAVLDLLARVLPIDAFAVNVVSILGLGVAIDYALFLVSRYRQELARVGYGARRAAIARAAETAGRAVAFSAVTVGASLSGLLVFRPPLLRSIAVAGMAVTLLAATLTLVVLPAALDVLGPRLERGRVPFLPEAPASSSAWLARLARLVIRRRVTVALGSALALMLLALPFRRLRPSHVDVRALPPAEEPRVVSDRLARDFPEASLLPVSLLVELDGDLTEGDRLARLYDYVERLRAVPGVARVDSVLSYAHVRSRDQAEELAPTLAAHAARAAPIVHGRYTLVRVISPAPPDSRAAQQLVTTLRRAPPPDGGRALVFGQAAALYDFTAAIETRAPAMIAVVMAAMFAVLFIAFDSAVLPIKAMVMTALSLTASFGAIVFVFQDGRLQRLLGYRSLGTTDALLPLVMFAVVFGLSMDYEVLILNRVREGWLRTHDNQAAIVEGVSATGRLVTSAAAVMAVVFSAFAVAPVVFVKALGLGMALAVVLDATVVRLLLVPSTMALLGRFNWWPGVLARAKARAHRARPAPA
jgi:RND superfamily putative drug exporter